MSKVAIPRVRLIRFGPYELDVRSGELRKAGIRIKLREQPVRILTLLLETPGEIVLREEIRGLLWPNDTVVEFDHGINSAIQKLRTALSDSAESPRYIETVARRGYRFLAQVEKVHESVDLPGRAEPARQPAPRIDRRMHWAWIAAAPVVLAVAFMATEVREKNNQPPVIRFNIPPPDGTAFGGRPYPSVSPDGRRIVFGTVSKNGYQSWIRSLNSPDAQPIAGTVGGAEAFWSPDGKSIAFFAEGGRLQRVDVSGPNRSPPVTLCDAPYYAGGAWSTNGVILFSTGQAGPIYRVADSGGTRVPATRLDPAGRELAHNYPSFLPDGRHFVFSALAGAPSAPSVTIKIGSLDSRDSKALLEADSNAIYAQGHLLYVRDEKLYAQPFDSRKLVLAGSPVVAAEQVVPFSGSGNFSAAESGTLVYFPGADTPNELAWFDASGKKLATVGQPLSQGDSVIAPVLSPDEKTVLVDHRESNNTDLWLLDAARGFRTRFTFDPAREVSGVWSPDGKSIAFSSNRKGHFDLFRQSVDRSQAEELLYSDGDEKYVTSWSPDGEFLLFDRNSPKAPYRSIWALPLHGERKPFPVFSTPAEQQRARFSPDGRWIAYESREGGRPQVFVARFRASSGAASTLRQVSTTEALPAQWAKDGKEVFYWSYSKRRLMASTIRLGENTVEIGREREVLAPEASIVGFDVARDGRIIARLRNPQAASRPITVVQNWTSGLKN